MAFEDITLLEDEEKLLREMADGIPRDKSVPNIMGLRGYELVDMIQEYPSTNDPRPYQMLYKINEYGKRYLLYLDKRESSAARERGKEKKNFWLNVIAIVISTIAAIASIVSAIYAIALSKQ